MSTSWWPFNIGHSPSSSPPAEFLHLSRLNIEQILDLIKCCEDPLNLHQCRSLTFKLEKTIQSIESLVGSSVQFSLVCGSAALENLYRVSEKAKQLVEKCCSINWCQEAAFQIQNEEAFKEILLETSLSYNTLYALFEDLNRNRDVCFTVDLRKSSTFEPPTADEVLDDRIALSVRLKDLVSNSSVDIRSQHLGKYLLGRLGCVFQQSIDNDFDVRSFSLWPDGKGPDREWSEKSVFLGGNVCKTSWLDVPCAKKLFQDEMQEDEWLAEAKILVSLNHPNIVKFLCCNKYETTHSWGHFIAMEQMETSLGSFIKRLAKEGAKLPLLSALDIILQIAYGMCYLHENGVAHRDLKPSNVVCSIIAWHGQYHLQVKVVDFGLSKVNLKASKSNTISRPRIGTTLYMPPEAFTSGRANWFKADVYSFSVMCSVILSGNEPFEGVKRSNICATVCRGERPKVSADIPNELASLMMEGWATSRDVRPDFVNICSRLEKLRHRLLQHHSLSSSLQNAKNDYSDLYIEETLKRRSEARQHQRPHVCPQVLLDFSAGDEWFELSPTLGENNMTYYTLHHSECEAEAGAEFNEATLVERIVCEANPLLIYGSGDSYDPDGSDSQYSQLLLSAGPATAVMYAPDSSDASGMISNATSCPEATSCIVPRTRNLFTIEIRRHSSLNFRQLLVELPVQQSPQRSCNVAQLGITALLPSCSSGHSGPWKCSQIAPRKRRKFTKRTLEIRPPKFKKILWFGTWDEKEIDRAIDAVNFYMGTNKPFNLPDSPFIFAQHPLGIEYRDLKPSCEELIQVGQKQVRASQYFARRVKEVIKAVTRGSKKNAQSSIKPLKSKLFGASEKTESLQNETTQSFYKPIMSCSSGSTYFSCASGSTYFSSSEDMVWYGASSEANSLELAPVQPSFLPPSNQMLPFEGEIPIESELFSLCNWGEEVFSLEEITFSSSPSVAAWGEGESGLMEDDRHFTALLWS